ncbi:hypothetical protein FSP39_016193 [Pinctada imbricata]|uniref:CUB domain-containing protein n=1 Tax=Pinctada imbricata TaxID=66713 RepID=A0AA88XJ25_PINIB|nr:hypothetical protein FSP39_016193 [Pinctada imbricata]
MGTFKLIPTILNFSSAGKRILLQFVKFDMQPKVSGQCVDYIEINDSNAELSLTSSQAPVITTEAMTTEAMTTSGSATDISTGTSATQDSTTQASTTQISTAQISSTDGTTSDSTGSNATDGTDGTTQDTPVTSGSSAGVGHHILCGDSASPYESGGRNLTLRFVTDGSVTASGFKILVMSFKESGTCSSEEFKCDTNR